MRDTTHAPGLKLRDIWPINKVVTLGGESVRLRGSTGCSASREAGVVLNRRVAEVRAQLLAGPVVVAPPEHTWGEAAADYLGRAGRIDRGPAVAARRAGPVCAGDRGASSGDHDAEMESAPRTAGDAGRVGVVDSARSAQVQQPQERQLARRAVPNLQSGRAVHNRAAAREGYRMGVSKHRDRQRRQDQRALPDQQPRLENGMQGRRTEYPGA